MATRRLTARHLVAIALLIGLGFLGNYFIIPFFFGVHWLFGSIATMIVIRLFGVRWGVLSALVISSYTYILWGHWLAMIAFSLEALVVGLLAERFKGTSLLLFDALFWGFVALPLTWLAYPSILNMDPTGTLLIFLKQSVNGLFNALVAMVAATHLPLRRWLLGEEQRSQIPVREVLFNLFVAFLMLPSLFSILLVSRREVTEIYRDIETLLSNQSAHAIDTVAKWRDQSQRAVAGLAHAASQEEMILTTALHEQLTMLLRSTPDLHRLSVLSTSGDVIATGNQDGAAPAILPPAAGPRPHPEIRAYLLDPNTPVITLSEPVLRNGKWTGTAQGVLDPRHAQRLLRDATGPFPLHLTLLDQSGRVLASSRSDLSPLQPFDRVAGSTLSWIHTGRYRRTPAVPTISMNRWRESQEVLESPVPGEGSWTLVAEVSLTPYRSRLYQVYNENLLIVLALTLCALILSTMISRWLAHPLLQLTAITRYLPQRLKGGEEILWPASPVLEIDSLVTDIRRMASALRERFDEIEQEARQQRALLSAAMEATDIPVLIADEQERIVYVNPPLLQEYGYTPDEILGRRPSILRAPTSDKGAVARLREAIRKGQRVTLDLVTRHKDGTLMDAELALSPLRAPDGRVTHFVGIYRNISARKAVERMKSQLVLSLSHELGAPLAAIRDSLDLLTSRAAQRNDASTISLLQVAHSNTAKLMSLLTQIQEYEEIEAGQIDLHPETLNACDLVGPAVRQMRPQFDEQGVALAVEIPPLPVVADPARVTQALAHLLQHALDSSKSGSQVTVSGWPGDGEVLFAVRDHGPGMPSAQIEQVFRAFDQGRLCTPALGLALARAVVRRLDGRMWVESEVGRGSTFCFSLPSSHNPQAATGGTLLVYADPPVAAAVAGLLESAGFVFSVVQHNAAAWDCLSTREYDTLLLDPQTPGALEFLHETRQSLRFMDLPVVILGPLANAMDRSVLQADPKDEAGFREIVRNACSRTA